MSKLEQNQIRYAVACVSEFAQSKGLSKVQAFLNEFYDVEHTLSFEDAVSDMTLVCQKNGGKIQ